MNNSAENQFAALTRFAAALGWQKLRVCQHAIDDKALAPGPFTVTWYESGNNGGYGSDMFLQINEAPVGHSTTHVGAVYAMRYRICTGWHGFHLPETEQELAAEMTRLEGWLHRNWFESLAKRRQFRLLHPECAGYSWRRIRDEGPPYSQAHDEVDPAN